MDSAQEILVSFKGGFSYLVNQVSGFKYQPGVTPFTNSTFPLIVGFVYLLVIWCLKEWMKNRVKFEIRTLALIHNFNMMVISIVCFLGMFSGVLRIGWIYKSEAPEVLLCDSKQREIGGGPLYFWTYIFYLSKFYELLDTVILALKKSQLRFLHLYHHWITMLLCYVSLQTYIPVQWIATTLNALVHIPMYYYYLCAILQIDVWWKKYFTTMQIMQFVCVLVTHGTAYWWQYCYTKNCTSWDAWGNEFGVAVIASYLLLFLQFYHETYKKPIPQTMTNGKKEK